jgi:MiaB-like tRNA modifying enzyme
VIPLKYYLRTYGCTLNAADSDIMRGILNSEGHLEVKSEDAADVVILNSCQVKSATEQKILQKLSVLHQKRKRLILAGCLAINHRAVWKSAPNATILGTSSIAYLPAAFSNASAGGRGVFRSPLSKENLPRDHPTGPIARIPIADGCLSACTFCVTKLARGKLSSYTLKGVVREAEIAIEHGAKEIQLTGQDTGAYGRDIGTDIVTLLNEVCDLPGDFRVRLGMINPQHVIPIQNEFFDCFKSRKLYKFIHLPIQSGSDSVLRAMKRGYAVQQFRTVANEFRKRFLSGVLATDIIVGFPGETDEDFEQTLSAIKEFRFDVVNISKFTPRPGTAAKKMKQLPSEVVKRRSELTAELCHQISRENNSRLIGKTYTVLVTEQQKTLTGRNNDYRQVALPPGANAKMGDWAKVKITGASHSCLLGNPI